MSEVQNPDWITAWTDAGTARQQAQLMHNEFLAWSNGAPHGPFEAFSKLAAKACAVSMLDVGCGAGIYSKVWGKIASSRRYLGCDQAPNMIREASAAHNSQTFIIADATNLPLADKSFQLVLLSGIVNCGGPWESMILEAYRVARRFILVHRVPVYLEGPDTHIGAQDIYGHTAPEREFNEQFFVYHVEQFGPIVGMEEWPRCGGNAASYLIDVAENKNDSL